MIIDDCIYYYIGMIINSEKWFAIIIILVDQYCIVGLFIIEMGLPEFVVLLSKPSPDSSILP